MKMLVTLVAVLGMGIVCCAGSAHAKNDAPGSKNNVPPTAEEIIVVEGVSYTDCCAQDPKSPCVKNGKCVCKSKKDCTNCMKHLKKCDGTKQKKCPQGKDSHAAPNHQNH